MKIWRRAGFHDPRVPGARTQTIWKIERARVADVLPSLPPEDDVADAFPLSKIALANANAQIVPGPVPLIRTAEEPNGYAASVPVGVPTGFSGQGAVVVRVRVKEGRITVGVLNRSGSTFLGYFNLEQAPDIQEIRVPVRDLSDLGSLMIFEQPYR